MPISIPPPHPDYNPVVLHYVDATHLDIYMPPPGGGPYGDWQRIRLILQGPHSNAGPESLIWDINGASAMIEGTEHKLLDLTTAPLNVPTTHTQAGQYSFSANLADTEFIGAGHGYFRRKRPAIGFVNGGAPEFFSTVPVGSLFPAKQFYMDQEFDMILKNGEIGGTWRLLFVVQQQSGKWVLRTKQFLTPTKDRPVYIRTLYSLMLGATGITHAQAGNLPPINVSSNNGAQMGNDPDVIRNPFGTDFGPDPRVWRFWHEANPQVQWRGAASQVVNGATVVASFVDRQNGNSHLANQTDGLDKIRASAVSYVSPQPWTQNIEITNDYSVGLF